MARLPVLLVVNSARSYRARRDACRATWFGALRSRVRHAVFVTGAGDFAVDKTDTAVLDCAVPDGYDDIWQKTLASFRWALHCTDWTHLFHCDDDTYVAPSRWLAAGIPRGDYVGCPYPHDWWPTPYASGGAGFWLTRHAVEILVTMLPRYVKRYVDTKGAPLTSDDLLIGKCLADVGVRLTTDARLQYTAEPLAAGQHTAHWIAAEQMAAMFARYP